MSVSDELITQFVKATYDNKQDNVEVTHYGTVVEDGAQLYVRLDGSDVLTPILTTAEIQPGERVIITIRNHTAVVMGNLDNPAFGTKSAGLLSSTIEQTAEAIRLEVTDGDAQLKSQIEQTAEAIRLEVADGDAQLKSQIEQQAGSIVTLVENQDEFSKFQQTVEGFSFMGTGGSVKIQGGDINLTGSITFSDLSDEVADELDSIPTKTSDLTNDSGYQTASGVVGIISNQGYVTEPQVTTITEDAISTASISANQITTGTLEARFLKLNGLLAILLGSTAYGYVGGSNTVENGPGAVLCGPNLTGYVRASDDGAKIAYNSHEIMCVESGPKATSALIVDSDQRLKHDISYDMEKYEQFFNTLKPCFYHLNKDSNEKYRIGFVAQDVLKGALESGLTESDIALVCQNDEYYGIAYTELIPLNTHMIQKLMKTISEQDERIAKLESLVKMLIESKET